MSAFVRNRLIDEVYLPLIGDNLAKQLGAAGDAKRTDQMGLLLLISPPGYGKTTLMEYVANRLGLVFVKVNGPALGHDVTSLDPAEAPERHRAAGGREDLLRAGDGQQRDALPRRHPAHLAGAAAEVHLAVRRAAPDRGRVGRRAPAPTTCAASGSRCAWPATRTPSPGERFRIPDMLANRADIYNLGDVLSGRDDAVRAVSYLENALTVEPGARAAGHTRPRPTCRCWSGWRAARTSVRPDQLSPPVLGGRAGGDPGGAAQAAAGAAGRAGEQPGVHRLGGAGRRVPHRAAVQAAGLATAT